MVGCTGRNNYLPSTTTFEQLSRGSTSPRAANTSTKGPRPFLSFPFCGGGAGPALQHRNGMIRCITTIGIHAALWLWLYVSGSPSSFLRCCLAPSSPYLLGFYMGRRSMDRRLPTVYSLRSILPRDNNQSSLPIYYYLLLSVNFYIGAKYVGE